MYIIQMVSTTYCSLKAASLNTTVRMVGRMYIPGQGLGDSNSLSPDYRSIDGYILSITFPNMSWSN